MSELSIKINFIIGKEVDPKFIMIGDASQWGVAENLPAYISIIPPGSKKAITLNFKKHSLTFLTSVNMGISCLEKCQKQELEDLDDGVWEICLKSSFEALDKKRYLLKTDSLRLEMDKLYIKQGIPYKESNNIVEALASAEWALNVAESEMRQGNIPQAMKAFTEAQKQVEKYKNCKECV